MNTNKTDIFHDRLQNKMFFERVALNRGRETAKTIGNSFCDQVLGEVVKTGFKRTRSKLDRIYKKN